MEKSEEPGTMKIKNGRGKSQRDYFRSTGLVPVEGNLRLESGGWEERNRDADVRCWAQEFSRRECPAGVGEVGNL